MVFCAQGWECPAGRHLPQERALSEDVLHIHPRVRQECGSTGRAEQEELGVWRCGAGVRGNEACSTCFLCVREGRGLGVNSGFIVYSWSEDVFPGFAPERSPTVVPLLFPPGQSSLCQLGTEALPPEARSEDPSVSAAAHRYAGNKKVTSYSLTFIVRKSKSAWLRWDQQLPTSDSLQACWRPLVPR